MTQRKMIFKIKKTDKIIKILFISKSNNEYNIIKNGIKLNKIKLNKKKILLNLNISLNLFT